MIRGLSDKRRLPRAGKIKLGVQVQGANGKMHPKATDYFVCPQEVLDALKVGDPHKFNELPIMFATDDAEQIFPQALKMYRQSGLFCAGDGEVARRWAEGELVDVKCPCPYLDSGDCGAVATLNFLLPDVPGIGVWQIDTGNKTSITTLNTALEQFHATFGGLRGIPFILRLEPHQTQRYDDKRKEMVKTTIYALRLDSPFSLRQIVGWRQKQGKVVEAFMPLSEPDREVKALEAGPAESDAAQQSAPKGSSEPTSPEADRRKPTPGEGDYAQRTAESGAPVGRREPEPWPKTLDTFERRVNPAAGVGDPDRPGDVPWDVSLCFAAAARCDVKAELYEKYLRAVYGVRSGDLSDAAVAQERAKLEPHRTEAARLTYKATLIRELNEALKRKGNGKGIGK